MSTATVDPTMVTQVFVDTEPLGRDRGPGEVRYDERNVPSLRDHGVGTVSSALGCVAGMGMRIRHNRHLARPAEGPKLGEGYAVQNTNALVIGVRVEFIIEDCIQYHAVCSVLLPE